MSETIPTPAEVAATTAVDPPAEPAQAAETAPKAWTPEEYEAELAKVRKEAAGWRTKLREVEPLAKAYEEAEEAKKTEVQRATERASQLEADLTARTNELNILRAAAKHGVREQDYDLLGSGTPEELDARAERIASMYGKPSEPTPAPPSDRPLETLRPGASPTPPPAVDNSYPADWRPRART
jgi:hypothetical protein